MNIHGHPAKTSLQRFFGHEVEVVYGERRGRVARWKTTTVSLSYAAALKRLRQVHGPTARFKQYDQANIEGWAVFLGTGQQQVVAALIPGKPDWAELLTRALT